MNYRIPLFLMTLLLSQEGRAAPSQSAGTTGIETYEIQTDMPAPLPPTHPFFTESPANELMEKLEALEERVKMLEDQSPLQGDGSVLLQSKEGASLYLHGEDIALTAPGKIAIDAKEVKIPVLGK